MLASERHRADLGRRGLERVSDRTWSSVVTHLVDHYDRVLADRERAGLRAPAARSLRARPCRKAIASTPTTGQARHLE